MELLECSKEEGVTVRTFRLVHTHRTRDEPRYVCTLERERGGVGRRGVDGYLGYWNGALVNYFVVRLMTLWYIGTFCSREDLLYLVGWLVDWLID